MTSHTGQPITEIVTTTYPSGKVVTSTSYSPTVIIATRMRVPAPLPVFKKGTFLVKPYSVGSVEFGGESGTCTSVYHRPDGVKFESKWSGPLDSSQAVYDNMVLMASIVDPAQLRAWRYNKALSKIGNSLFDGGVELGELRETLELIRNPMQSLRKLLDKNNEALRRQIARALRDPVWFARTVKEVGSVAADTWLQVRYGVRPLISSIQSAIDLASMNLQKADINAIRRKGSQTVDSETKKKTVIVSSRHRVHLVAKSETRVHAYAYYRRYVDQTWRSALGLAPEAIPEIVWELTRLSFVWDWIFSIGPFLGAISYKPGVTLLGGLSGFKTTHTVTCTSERRTIQGDVWATTTCGETLVRSHFQRFTQAGALPPSYLGPSNLSLAKTVDSLALLWGAVVRRT